MHALNSLVRQKADFMIKKESALFSSCIFCIFYFFDTARIQLYGNGQKSICALPNLKAKEREIERGRERPQSNRFGLFFSST